MAWLACPKSGGCIFPGKKPPEAAYPGAHGFFVRQNPGWPAWHGFLAETTLSQNMVLVLIGLHMAPNGVLTGSLSRKFRGGSPDRHQIQPSCQKCIEIFWDLGRVGSGFLRIFRIFLGMIRNGPPGPGSIIWGSGGPWDYYLGVSWGKKGSPQFPLKSR